MGENDYKTDIRSTSIECLELTGITPDESTAVNID